MKNILLVNLGKEFGGAEHYVIQIGSLLKGKYRIHFLTRKSSPLKIKLDELKLGSIIEIDFKLVTLKTDICKVKTYIAKRDITVVHANGINSIFFLNLLTIKDNVLFVATVHGIAEYDRINRNFIIRKVFSIVETLCLRRFDKIIAVSKSIRNYLIAQGVSKNKIVVIYHAIEIHYPLLKYEKHNPLMICYVGRLEKVKNVEYLIKALKSIKNIDRTKCNIYGIGTELEHLESLVSGYGLEKYISFKGFCSDTTQVYRTHDILIQPSLYEAFGLTVIEGMSNGIPVLCSDVGGIKEIVRHGYNGFLFDINDLNSLVILIDQILDNLLNLESVRLNAYKEVKERFCPSEFIRKLSCVYDSRDNTKIG